MKSLNRFHKTLLKMFCLLLVFIFGIYLINNPPPWKSWAIVDPTKEQVENIRIYFLSEGENYWCGEFTYTNDQDCEFRIFVTNPKSDTLFNQIIKAPSGLKEKRFKKRNFTIRGSKDVEFHYIPVNVPKKTKITFNFRNYRFCDN